jgi:hypothetical protein
MLCGLCPACRARKGPIAEKAKLCVASVTVPVVFFKQINQ